MEKPRLSTFGVVLTVLLWRGLPMEAEGGVLCEEQGLPQLQRLRGLGEQGRVPTPPVLLLRHSEAFTQVLGGAASSLMSSL